MSVMDRARLIGEAGLGRLDPGRFLGPGAIGLLVGGAVWEVLGQTLHLTFLPPLSKVAGRVVDLTADGQIVGSLSGSLSNLAMALVIAFGLGIPLGLLMGISRAAAAALDPYINALLTAPSLVFAPIFFSIWGLGSESIVVLIVTYSMFVVVVNTQAAVRAVDVDLVEMAHSFSASRTHLVLLVTLPGAVPLMLAGARLAVARGVKGMINGEMFIALFGLGKLIEEAQHRLDAATVIAVLAVVVFVALTLIKVVDFIDARLTSWLPRTTRGD